MKIEAIPYTILAVAPFRSGAGAPAAPVAVCLESLDAAIATLKPEFQCPVPKGFLPSGWLAVQPSRLKDFKPDGLIQTVPELRALHDAGLFLDESLARALQPEIIRDEIQSRWPSLGLDLSISEAPPREQAVDDLLAMVALPSESPGGAGSPKGWRSQVRERLAGLVAAIFADESFRQAEAAWRGLEVLLRQGPVKEGGTVRLRLLPAGREDLPAVLDRLVTELLDDPPSLVVIDHSFDSTPPDLELLAKVAGLGETLLAPCVAWVNPRFLQLGDWSELGRLSLLAHAMEDPVFAKWRHLREEPASHWLALACNRFLARAPYGRDNPSRGVDFQETDPLWVSPVWALAALIAQSLARTGWPSRFTAYPEIALADLAVGDFGAGAATATETLLGEERVRQFAQIGLIPLVGMPGRDIAFIPREATAAGTSLRFQLFFNQLTGFLLRLKDFPGAGFTEGPLEENLTRAIEALFRETGHRPPDDLEIRQAAAGEGDTIPLYISLTPPRTILSAQEKLEFTFTW